IRWKRPAFLRGMAVLALFNLVLSAALIVGIPVAVVQVLNMSDSRLGLTQGAMGLGGLLGGVLIASVGGRLRLRQGSILLLAASLAAAIMAAALLPGIAASAGYWTMTAMSFAMMVMSTMLVVLLSAAVQRQTPPELLGKVMAFIMAAVNCASPLGQVIYGVLFGKCAAWAVLLGAAAAASVTAVYSRRAFYELDADGRGGQDHA
ncbi:MAG: MFS transporter, partial [Oscillibacter sp.]|nr:MFS transporter [Oscillibacter sp.]